MSNIFGEEAGFGHILAEYLYLVHVRPILIVNGKNSHPIACGLQLMLVVIDTYE